MAEIGRPERRREYEPMPQTEPHKEPAAPTPTPDKEPVPAGHGRR